MLRRKLRDPWNPLPHYACGDRILVRVSAFDAWIAGFRVQRKPVPEHLRAVAERAAECNAYTRQSPVRGGAVLDLRDAASRGLAEVRPLRRKRRTLRRCRRVEIW